MQDRWILDPEKKNAEHTSLSKLAKGKTDNLRGSWKTHIEHVIRWFVKKIFVFVEDVKKSSFSVIC